MITERTQVLDNRRESTFNAPLHGLRGVASLMVLIGHVLGGYNNEFLGGADNWLAAANRVGTFGVELFFILSGYVILNSIKRYDFAEFVQHRFWRIYPVFLCFTLTYFAGNRLLQIEPQTDSLTYLVSNLGFLDLFLGTPHLSPNAWTITYEIWFYLLSFLLLKPLFRSRDIWMSVLGGILCLVFAIHFPLTMYFAAGALINTLEPWIHRRFHSLPTFVVGALELAVVGALVLVLSEEKLRYSWAEVFAQWRIAVVFALTVLLFAFVIGPKSLLARFLDRKALLSVGTFSYSLYLSHPYPHFLLKRLIGARIYDWLPYTVSGLVFLVSVLVVALPFAYLVYRSVEIFPYRLMTGRTIYARA
jgi:peptidoglycan/LPS O-acetylase OafA/YrhL